MAWWRQSGRRRAVALVLQAKEMTTTRTLAAGWRRDFERLVASVRSSLCISSPYVTDYGVQVLLANLDEAVRETVTLTLLTDLSPLNIAQGATDPQAIWSLSRSIRGLRVCHLPRVHAKVFVQDAESAIVTSGNLTAGGLAINFEYGVLISDRKMATEIEADIQQYSALGANISKAAIEQYRTNSARLQQLYAEQQSHLQQSSPDLQVALAEAADDLIRLRLDGGGMHTVFAATISYLLTRYGPLSTQELHVHIADLHPDLCDDSVDRVIEGKRFGKKWKHAVRTAQQHLKKQQKIVLLDGVWRLV